MGEVVIGEGAFDDVAVLGRKAGLEAPAVPGYDADLGGGAVFGRKLKRSDTVAIMSG